MSSSYPELDPVALRPTVAFVDRGALRHNVTAVKRAAGERRLMAIVKANAYGHGLIETAQTFLAAGVDELGVAFLEEGVQLRRAGIRVPILVLGGIIGNQISHFIEYDLGITASSPYKLRQIEEVCQVTGRQAQVHLKIDTGMGRIGVQWDRVDALVEAAMMVKNVSLRSVFTHFASADSRDLSFTRLQIERFAQALSRWESRGFHIPQVHVGNSGALLQHDLGKSQLVRPGALLYGFYPSPEVARSIEVRPALSLKTRVVYFKVLGPDSPISYDGRYRTARQSRIVTLPVGYGDGYLRALSNKAEVLIGGQRRRVVGSITMDAMMVELGDASAFNGDEAVLIGKQGSEEVRVEELAERAGTIPYEILTNINTRVPRVYVG
ncbi:MAG: alanine racemase [Myxococcota bacterium]